MPTAPPPSRDVALETRFFWERFKKPIIAAAIVVLLAATAFAGYRFYSDRRAAAASAALATAKAAQAYEEVIARYANTAAAADAYILLAEAQRKERKFPNANKTLETFIAKFPKHEFVSTAKMAMAANLDSMGKTNEALVMYQQIAAAYPNSYVAPLAMLSQVYILKSKNRNDDARRICETMLTQYRTSFWAGEAMQQLRLLKPIATSTPPTAAAAVPAIPPMLAIPAAPVPQAPPAPNQPQSVPSPKKP
jgi:TolA-binding protein